DFLSDLPPGISEARFGVALSDVGDERAGTRIVLESPSVPAGSIEFGAVPIGRLVATLYVSHPANSSGIPSGRSSGLSSLRRLLGGSRSRCDLGCLRVLD